MRNFKKILSLVLCMAMMLSVMVVGAGAAFSDQSKIKNTEAVDMCSVLNIINGYTDGSFRPDGTITRAEACKMICVALNGGKEPVLGTSATATFTDIKGHWAEGYIEYCVSEGIVAGIGGGKFAPNATVTGSQFAKMLLIALGYSANEENFLGNAWEVNVNVKATQKGLYEDLESMDPAVALTRDNAAQMVWNALQAKEVKYEYTLVGSNGNLSSQVTVTDKNMPTLLADKYGVKDDESAQMIGFTYNSDKAEWTYYFSNTSTVVGDQDEREDGNMTHFSFTSDVDYTDLYLQNVKVVYTVKTNGSVDKVYGMYADDCVVLATAYVGDFDTVKSDDDEVTIAGVDYDLEKTAANTKVYTFTYGKDVTPASANLYNIAKTQANVAFEVVAVDYDDNGDIDFFVMKQFEVGQIVSVGSKNFTTEDLSETSFKFEDVVTYDGMDEDDFVVYTPAKYTATNDDTFAKVDTVLKGDVTAVKGDYEFAVDGTWYEATKALDVEAGDAIKDAPVVNGYVFAGDTTGTANIEDYAVVVATDGNGYGYTVKLLFSDGSKKIVDAADNYANMKGWLVTFEINSDDEYELTGAINSQADNTNAKSGFDYVAALKDLKDSDKNSSGKVKYIDGMNINDDAVIFMNDNGDYKVITGAQLKTIKGANITQVVAYANDDSSTGFKSVEMAKVVTNADTVSADTLYGYVTADPITVRNADDKSVTQLTIWTEDGKEVTLNTNTNKASFAKTLEKGAFISFGINSDNEIDAIENAGVTAAAVTSYDGTYIAFNDNADRIEITDDTVIVYVDVEGPAGSDNGKIQLATKTGMDPDAKDYVKYYNNVAYKTNTAGDEIDVIFVDISNDIEDKI